MGQYCYHTLVVLLLLCASCTTIVLSAPPNILLIVADDLGWRDVSYHGSEIPTPTIDSLATNGVQLDNYYVQPLCSPTRTSLLCGKYPARYGAGYGVWLYPQRAGLPLNETTLAQRLKAKNYTNHLVGKWHAGFFAKEYTPTYRGFDTFFGYYGSHVEYTGSNATWETHGYCYPEQVALGTCAPTMQGLDLHDNRLTNLTVARGYENQTNSFYFTKRAVDLIKAHNTSNPMFLYFAPENVHTPLVQFDHYVNTYCSHILEPTRKKYCGMVTLLDEMVKNLTVALKAKGMWNNTVVIFTTDNGGIAKPLYSYGVNYPYRGQKTSYFEGGIKATAFVYSELLPAKAKGTSYKGLMHVADLHRTIAGGIAGITVPSSLTDTINHWAYIRRDKVGSKYTPRSQILLNWSVLNNMEKVNEEADMIYSNFSPNGAFRDGDMKLIYSDPDGIVVHAELPYYRPTPIMMYPTTPCGNSSFYDEKASVHLYNITADPYECNDLISEKPEVALALLKKLTTLGNQMPYPQWPRFDANSNPALHNNAWVPWI